MKGPIRVPVGAEGCAVAWDQRAPPWPTEVGYEVGGELDRCGVHIGKVARFGLAGQHQFARAIIGDKADGLARCVVVALQNRRRLIATRRIIASGC
jgi:hypothetical protein